MNVLKPLKLICRFNKMERRCTMSNYVEFHKLLRASNNIVALTGAGVSAESGIPTFRGSSGLWKTHAALDLATPSAFASNPGLVWEFYQWRRETALNAQPNSAHIALAQFEEKCKIHDKNFAVITQNVDGLHQRAGSKNVVELHGSVVKIMCTKCKFVEPDTRVPVCEALRGRGDPNIKEENTSFIPKSDLPKCKKCKSLARPYIVWFGENLDPDILNRARFLVDSCDLFLVIGTSSVVYPAAAMAHMVLERGKPVVEFNINEEPESPQFSYHFPGKCGSTLPKALDISLE